VNNVVSFDVIENTGTDDWSFRIILGVIGLQYGGHLTSISIFPVDQSPEFTITLGIQATVENM
jgi:hypothetical protein